MALTESNHHPKVTPRSGNTHKIRATWRQNKLKMRKCQGNVADSIIVTDLINRVVKCFTRLDLVIFG